MSFVGRRWHLKAPLRNFCDVGKIKNFFSWIKNPPQPEGEFRADTIRSTGQVDSLSQKGKRIVETLLPKKWPMFLWFLTSTGSTGRTFYPRVFLGRGISGVCPLGPYQWKQGERLHVASCLLGIILLLSFVGGTRMLSWGLGDDLQFYITGEMGLKIKQEWDHWKDGGIRGAFFVTFVSWLIEIPRNTGEGIPKILYAWQDSVYT